MDTISLILESVSVSLFGVSLSPSGGFNLSLFDTGVLSSDLSSAEALLIRGWNSFGRLAGRSLTALA